MTGQAGGGLVEHSVGESITDSISALLGDRGRLSVKEDFWYKKQ